MSAVTTTEVALPDTQRVPRRIRLTAMAWTGIAIVVVLLLAGVLAPILAPHSPDLQSSDALAGPSGAHLLGTDEFGRDVFSRMLYGIRVDALLILVAVPAGALLGLVLGLVSGLGGWIDSVLQRLFDVMLAFTALIAGVTVASIAGPGKLSVLLTVLFVNIPLFGRITRSSVVSLRDRDFVVASRLVGASPRRVLLRHILPNSVEALVVQLALSLSMAVFIEGAMSFIGLGVLLPEASLGNMLRKSTLYLDRNPWYAIGPIVVVTLLVVGFQLIADGLNKGRLRR